MIKKYRSEVGEIVLANNLEDANSYLQAGRPVMLEQGVIPPSEYSTELLYVEDTDGSEIRYSCKQIMPSNEGISFIAIPTMNINQELLEKLVAERVE